MQRKKIISKTVIILCCIILAAFFIFPILLLFINSFKSLKEIYISVLQLPKTLIWTIIFQRSKNWIT